MKGRNTLLILLVIVLSSTLSGGLVANREATGDTIEYHLEHQWVMIWILTDGTIDLLYDIEISCDQGEIRRVDVLQPVDDFTIGEAKDEKGHTLRTESIIETDSYAARVWLSEPLSAGSTLRFTVVSNVRKMIWEDETNEGNVGMLFIPATWRGTTTNTNLRISIVLPRGVGKSEVKTTETLWDNAFYDEAEEGKLVVYWERNNWDPSERFECGVSFPKEYVENYEKKDIFDTFDILLIFGVAILVIGLVGTAIFLVIVAIVRKLRRGYSRPIMAVESLGVRRGLTAVEAAQLLGLTPQKIVVMTLYGLMKKHAVWVRAVKPTLKLKVTDPRPESLHDYEEELIKAIRKDGTLSEKGLAKAITVLRSGVQAKMRGYHRRDTIDYYRGILNKAWGEVRRAETPELMSDAYDEQLLWLLLDERYEEKSRELFQDTVFYPRPGWWWYQYNDGYFSTTPKGRIQSPRESLDLKEIPGVRFADTVASAMEQTTHRFVSDVEKFADAIIPEPPPSESTSHEPIHGGSSCVCACASCACACACVSCACACASGGGGVG